MNTLSWIVDPSLTTRLTLALLHFLWQGCAGGLLVVVCGALFKHVSARFRYTLYVAALFLMAACLPVTFCLVEIPIARVSPAELLPKVPEPEPADTAPGKQQTPSVARIDHVAPENSEPRQDLPGSIATPDAVQLPAGVVPLSAAPENLLATSTFQFVSRWVAALYLLGVALILGRLLRGVWGGRRLRKIANIIDDAPLLEMVDKLARRLGLKVVPAVAWCGQISIPVVVGIVKPMILLPTTVVSGLTPDQLQALLLHELAHIRRFDPIVNLLQRIIEAVLFFHPVVWFVSRRISVVREHAADDMVLAAGCGRPVYADALVRAAELAAAFSCPDLARRATVLGASGTSQSEFKLRVLRLLEDSQGPKLQLSRTGVLALLMVVALGGMLTWSQTDKGESGSPAAEGQTDVPFAGEFAGGVNGPATPQNLEQLIQAATLPDDSNSKVNGQRNSIRVNLKLPRQEFLLGESIPLEYVMTNDGEDDASYSKGAFYPDLRVNDGFRMSAVQIDENEKPIDKPVASWTKPQATEGKGGGFQLKPSEMNSTTLFVTRYLRFLAPGRYRVRVENVNRFEVEPTRPYSAGETIITLRQPTAAEARQVFEKMKQAPRQAYDGNAMKFLPDAADFQAMHQPVYLPILKEYALESDLDALPALERMESKAANDVLVDVLSKALDRDDWRTARACFQHLKSFLPYPGWYLSTSGAQDQANRDRTARIWGADFVPVLARLARRLNVEVAAQMRTREAAPPDADSQDPEFLKVFRNGYFPPEHPQSLLIDIDYIYRCVGRPEDFEDCLAAFAQSIELTKSLPLETQQYFRPRGSAYGFRHTVVYLIQRGAQVPRQPKHPGEAAAFALALRNQPGFRPEGWEAVLMQWLKSTSPYLAEMILDFMPASVPSEVLDYLPTLLADDYIDLKIAACQVAQKNARLAYREPLQKILDRADDKYLRKYAVDAARANGLSAQYDNDAPFVDKSSEASEPPEKKEEGPGEPNDSKTDKPPVKAATRVLLLPDHSSVTAVGFDHGDKELVTASMPDVATIRRWDLGGKKLISEIKLASGKDGRPIREGTLMLAGDRRHVIAATDDYVGIWDSANGKLNKKLPFPKKEREYDGIGFLAATPDLSVIVGSLTSSYKRTTLIYGAYVIVWDGISGKTLRIITHKGETSIIVAMALSSDGKRLATTNGDGAKIWDTSTGQEILHVSNDNKGRKHSDPDFSNHVWSVQFSPNGKQLAIGDILGVKLVDSDSGKLLQQLEGPYRYTSGQGHANLVFSKDGQLLARLGTGDKTGGKGTRYTVPIWSTETGQKLFELPTDANDGAFSLDKRRFAIGLSDFQMGLAIWQLGDGTAEAGQTGAPRTDSRTTLLADDARATKAAIDPNGEIVGRLVDIATGKPVAGATVACGAIINDSGKGGGATAITDAEGNYRLPVPSPGIYMAFLENFDKEPGMTAAADDGILVESGKVAQSQLFLVKGRKVTGKVVDADGKPFANISVSCYSAARPHSGGIESVKTKNDGTFEFALPPGRVHIYIFEPVGQTEDNPFGAGRYADADITVSATEENTPITLTLAKREFKFGDPEWLKRSTPGTQIVRHANAADVTGTVVDVSGQPLAQAKVFQEDGPINMTDDKGEFKVGINKGTQFVMHAFAPGYHLWFGTPAAGDVLKIVMEKKDVVRPAVDGAAREENENGARKALREKGHVTIPQSAAEFEKLIQNNATKLAEGRLELLLDYEWRRPTKENPKRTVATQGTMQRIRKGKLLRIDFERQIANPSPMETNFWQESWVTGFDGDLEYSYSPSEKLVVYGELRFESRSLDYWGFPHSVLPQKAAESQIQVTREQRYDHEVWNVRIEDMANKTVIVYSGVRPDRGYLASRIDVTSNGQPFSRTEFQDIFEPQPGTWVARTMLVDAYYLDRPAMRAGYTAHRTKTTITRLELGDDAKLKDNDFVLKLPKDAQVRQWERNQQRMLPAGIHQVQLRFEGDDRQAPLAGLKLKITNGESDRKKTLGTFTTNARGEIQVLLPEAFYYLHLTSDKELPYLHVEALWKGDSHATRRELSLYVTKTGPEKWLGGKRRDDGRTAGDGDRRLPEITYTLLPACELVLRAVDAETGKGLSGAEFYEENAAGEEWGHPIYGENLGTPFRPYIPTPIAAEEWLTDKDGNFKRLVGANGDYVYGVLTAPAGYELLEPSVGFESKIVYGQRRAEHVFKFTRTKTATATEKPKNKGDENPAAGAPPVDNAPGKDDAAKNGPVKNEQVLRGPEGSLTGRFVYEGERPVPQDLEPSLSKLAQSTADTPMRIDEKPEIPADHFLASFNEAPWKDVLQWYGRVMGLHIELKTVPPGNFSYDNPRPLNHVEIIQLIKGELLRRGYCFAGDGERLSVQTADVAARMYEKSLREEFLHGQKLRQGPEKFDAYFEIVDVRIVGTTQAPAPSGPAIAYVLKANRSFSAQEATAFWRSCILENSITSLKTGQPVVVDGFAVLYKGKWLGTNVPALEKGERIEIWQNEFEEWNARPPSDVRVVIEGHIVGQGGKPVAARIRQFLMEGKTDDLGDSDLAVDPKLARGAPGKAADLDQFLNWAYGGDLIVDKQGRFQVTLRHGTQFVRTAYLYAIAPGYAPQRVGPLAVGYEKPAAPLTIELEPGFTGRLRLLLPDGKPLDQGEVEVIAQDDLQAEGLPLAKLPVDGKPIAVGNCPTGPLLLKVRVPGFAEQVIRDVRIAAGEATDVEVLPKRSDGQ